MEEDKHLDLFPLAVVDTHRHKPIETIYNLENMDVVGHMH
jgi:hypothetical protein